MKIEQSLFIYIFVWARKLPRSQSMMSRKKRRDKLVTNDRRRDFQDRLFSSGSNIKEQESPLGILTGHSDPPHP